VAVPAAKTAFALLVVHLPMFAAQMVIVIASGVPLSIPQLLLNQFVLFAYLSLPVMLVAALTKTISQFVLTVVFVAALVLLMLGGMSDLVRDLLDPLPLAVAAWLWVLALVSAGALFWQYRKRQALIVASYCAGVLLLCLVVTTAMARTIEYRSRLLLVGASTDVPAISFRPSAERLVTIDRVARGFVNFSIPLEISRPEKVDFQITEVHVRMLGGAEDTIVTHSPGPRPAPDGYWVNAAIPQYFLESDLSIRIVIDSVQYEISDGDAIPLDGRPVIVDGRAQCGRPSYGGRMATSLLCRSAFGRSWWSVDRTRRLAVATDPFQPFRLSMNPVVEERIGALLDLPGDPGTSVATRIRVATGYLRQVVEIDRIRLQAPVPE
jgi:hypothetical protein